MRKRTHQHKKSFDVLTVRRLKAHPKIYQDEARENYEQYSGRLKRRRWTEADYEQVRLVYDPEFDFRANRWELHHIIPIELAQKYPLLGIAAEHGFDINDTRNLLPMPSVKSLKPSHLLPGFGVFQEPHQYHEYSYTQTVINCLEMREQNLSNGTLTAAQLPNELYDIADYLKPYIVAGDLKLKGN